MKVGPGGSLAVSAIDEAEGERTVPTSGQGGGVADDAHHGRLQAGPGDGAAPVRQRVDPAHLGIDEIGLVVLPSALVLLRAAVMVDGEQGRPRGLGSRAQVHG